MADTPDDLPPIEALRKQIYKAPRQDRIRIILARRATGESCIKIAKDLGTTPLAIYRVISRQRQRVRDDGGDPQVLLDTKCKKKAVRNLDRILDDVKHDKHWQATRDTLYGTGMLTRHVHTKTEGSGGNQLPALTVNVVAVQKADAPQDAPRDLPDITVEAIGTPRDL